MIPVSLRTEQGETAYQNSTKGDIANLPSSNVGGLKLLPNQFPYDIAHQRNDMLVDTTGNFWDFWVKLGTLLESGQLPYDQLIINMPHKQSQSHVFHAHLLNFKDSRSDFVL